MKEIVLSSIMKPYNDKNYNKEQLEIIRYGFESIYILITKTIFIFFVAYILNILKEVILFSILYNIIRMPSFGLHATKSWICLVSSTIIFIAIPYICNNFEFDLFLKAITGIIAILLIYKNAPADTYKRPIVSKKRRDTYKFISTLLAIVMIYSSLLINNNFISNSLVMAVIIQCFMISPFVYSLFKLTFNNYKTIQKMD